MLTYLTRTLILTAFIIMAALSLQSKAYSQAKDTTDPKETEAFRFSFKPESLILQEDFYFSPNIKFSRSFDSVELRPFIGIASPSSLSAGILFRYRLQSLRFSVGYAFDSPFSNFASKSYGHSGILIGSWLLPGIHFFHRLRYGLLYNLQGEAETNSYKIAYLQAMDNIIGLESLLYKTGSHTGFLNILASYKRVFEGSVNVYSFTVASKNTLFNTGGGKLLLNFISRYSHSSHQKIFGYASFFSFSPPPLSLFREDVDINNLSLNGDYAQSISIGYRLFPFPLAKYRYPHAGKGLFIQSTVHFGQALTRDIKRSSLRFEHGFSVLGGIGYMFPSGDSLSIDVGWNDREGIVLHLVF